MTGLLGRIYQAIYHSSPDARFDLAEQVILSLVGFFAHANRYEPIAVLHPFAKLAAPAPLATRVAAI